MPRSEGVLKLTTDSQKWHRLPACLKALITGWKPMPHTLFNLLYGFDTTVYRSSLLESAKKVGAQSPTKIPNLSAWAFDSASAPPVKNQMAIEPRMETNPRTKQSVDKFLKNELFMELTR